MQDMEYPSQWIGSTELEDISGVAKFKIEGVDYSLRLDCFASYQILSEMLDAAFGQGKRFAAQAIRSHINTAMNEADRKHDLIN